MVDDSNWEPDGVTLQVRFYEGGSAYQEAEIAAATLQTPKILEVTLNHVLNFDAFFKKIHSNSCMAEIRLGWLIRPLIFSSSSVRPRVHPTIIL